ncbi:MAG: DNA mismatch repair endonuclease MutL [Clostridia bacterium]|nr:DNA mismatch repair endonuclease MutL [Clostridia bacterium]
MGQINVLSFEVANLIAAGEVVDRPSSVVKELLENAIDSGANRIIIEIKNGGSTFIRITDNGCGIEHSQLPIAILRHATSKIKDKDDLESIMTLGFRGEALAAISSVSKMRIMSKMSQNELGSLLEAHAGKIVSHTETGCADGTTVIVEDLFYNVPARKKFLKKDSSETASITSVVEKVAMSRPDISFRYICDGELKYLTSGDGILQNVIYAILGRDVAKKTIKVDRNEDGIYVSGFISTPEIARASRSLETFFVNSRFIRSKALSAVVEEAYSSYIPQGRFPFCVLNVTIDPKTVDVNVHPSKLEVKFSNERIVNQAVYYAVRSALSTDIERPELFFEPEEKITQKAQSLLSAKAPINDGNIPAYKGERIVFDSNLNIGTLRQNNTIDYSGYNEKNNHRVKENDKIDVAQTYVEDEFSLKFPKNAQATKPQEASNISLDVVIEKSRNADDLSKEITIVEQNKIVPEYRIIGEAFNCYVIVELGDTMYLIDKHAAHERIIFEDLKKKLNEKTPSSQMLLVPIPVTLDSSELGALEEWKEDINKIGFGFTIQNGKVFIDEIPAEIETCSAQDSFIELVSKLSLGEAEAQRAKYDFFEKALYQTSCKAAIKAGRVYEKEHIKWIVDRVLTLDNIKYCPHGRPIAFEVTKHFLEKQFERIK